VRRLKKRAEFLHVAAGRRWTAPHFTLQAARRETGKGDEAGFGLGFTVTKKVGNAVERNRIRRRLRAAASATLALAKPEGLPLADHDYVIIARRSAIAAPFETLIGDLMAAFAGVHRRRSSARSRA